MRIVFLFLGLFFSVQTYANGLNQSVAEFNSGMNNLDLTPFIRVLADPEHRLTFEDISSPQSDRLFKALADTGNNFGFDTSVYWIKFDLTVDDSIQESLILHFEYSQIDDVVFYSKGSEGIYRPTTTGDKYPFLQRDLNFRDFLFEINQNAQPLKTYYMRLQTQGSMQIPLSVWRSSAFIEYADSSAMAYGFYYGVMIILMLAASVAYFQLRDFLYLLYAMYLFSFLTSQLALNGFGFQHIWPDMNEWANQITAVSIALVVISGSIFCGTFLRIWRYHDRFRYLYNFLIGAGLLSVLVSLFGEYSLAIKIAAVAAVLLPPIVITSNILVVLSGYRPARFFLMAWGVFLIGVFSASMLYFGWVERNFYTVNSMQIASLLEILILGYVLMENVRQLYKEKEAVTLTANRYLKELNEGLESMVAERTRELSDKNKMLRDLALRDSMTRLLNHNTSIDHLNLMLRNAQRYGHNLSVIMMDIDDFKSLNDRYGHLAGDVVIQTIANLLKVSVRDADICGRYGGEEFILILPETAVDHAVEIAENIRLKLMKIKLDDIDKTQITASFGVSVYDIANPKTDLIHEADKALYQAKENGRNQVVVSSSMAKCSEAVLWAN